MGVTGTIGMTAGINAGRERSIYGTGTRHRGFDIAGKDLVNPTGALLSSALMLKHMGLFTHAHQINQAVRRTLS